MLSANMKVTTEIRERTLVIMINRPDKRNCVDGETAQLLHDAWIRFRDDDNLWVAILTGAGDVAFSAGADLAAIPTLGPGLDVSLQKQRWFVEHGSGFMGYTRQVDIDKPILAAVNGFALAGGLELACLADIRVVEEHAELGVACRRWGVPLVDGGTQRLPRIIGLGRAMEMILTGRFVKAHEALQSGLANEVVPKGKSLERCLEMARLLCALPQTAMRTDKKAAQMGFGRSLEEGLRIEAELGQWAIRDPELIEGAKRFLAGQR
jgi:enoyl-CoA hydratase